MMGEVIDNLSVVREREGPPPCHFVALSVWADELEEAGDPRAAGLRTCVEKRRWPYWSFRNKFYWFNDERYRDKGYCNGIGELVNRILGEGRCLISHAYPTCSAALLALASLLLEEP